MLIQRPRAIDRLLAAFQAMPAVMLAGPRHSGKTTLARIVAERETDVAYFDLESPEDQRRLAFPAQTLSPLSGLVIIDDIQRQPALFETVAMLLDRPDSTTRFLLLSNASPDLVKGATASLAGRAGVVVLSGIDLGEIPPGDWRLLWQRGGFPGSYLAPSEEDSQAWRENAARTFLERDIPQLGITIAADSLRRFWTMLAHAHGQVWNAAEFARSLGSSEGTARNYLDILQNAYLVRVLPPWQADIGKRQVKAPKVYVRDSGMLHALLELGSFSALSGHPKLGASFEGFVIEQLLALLKTRTASFWATHAGAELDLLVTINGKRYGFDCKFQDTPATTRSMHVAMADLELAHLYVIYPGEQAFELTDTISALPVSAIPALAAQLLSAGEQAATTTTEREPA